MTPLTVYTRAGCHLCTAMLTELRAECADREVKIEVVDVDSSPALVRRYGLRVPVLVGSDGDDLCYGRLDPDALDDYLKSR